ncbi:hypothetical protein Bmayo_05040 (plasmid) [Borreliella mayonii]|uniref:Variable large protein n=1 Tax=Borreliella mayonii TaxID=1674146 RepID=A0AAC9PJG2_9SPIR|nr:hypothetical protein A7X70_05505 [Borreliella mayonii]APT00388.1 hypothetical protein Bmayo_05040 [Borreliella mayonii]
MKAITDAANKAAKAASGGDTSIGNVVSDAAAGAAAGAADASSVQGIAKGMKAIVDAAEATAGKAAGSKEKKELLKAASDGNATGTGNEDAGHLFSRAADQGANNAQAQKAAGAINAVSGEQILKEIVDAAEKSGAAGGQQADQANNPISAAIGAAQGNGGAFTAAGGGGMNQNSKVAAAIVLRGMAKNGKFAVANAAHANHKDGVKSAVEGDC